MKTMKTPTAKQLVWGNLLLLCLLPALLFTVKRSPLSTALLTNPTVSNVAQKWQDKVRPLTRASAAVEAGLLPVSVAERAGPFFATTSAKLQRWTTAQIFSRQSDTTSQSAVPQLSWQKQSSNSLARLQSVYFTDAQHGWAAGSNGTLLKTVDGGATWERLALPPQFSRDLVREVWALDAQRLRLLGEYNLTQRPTSADLDARSFLLASDDGGASWQQIELARPPDKPRRRTSRSTTAQPNEQDQLERQISPVLTSFAFTGKQCGWLVGESGMIQATRDDGSTWQMQHATSRKLFYDVFALDDQQAWIVGGGGLIFQTADAGATWREQSSGITQTLRAVQFLDARRGWAAGVNGTIIATTNGGNRWQPQPSNSTQPLNDIFFVNANEGWAAGERGALLHTRDGGATWQDESLKTFASLNKLYFIAPNCGWVVGANGSIYKFSANAETPLKGTSR
jgi:photosystem II stability/assembly factor-like uncharacterized protein